MTKSETNITGDVHGDVYSGNIGQIGDIHINTGGGNYYEGPKSKPAVPNSSR
jgi:hypothetical protein